jgi:hypothetical protein
MWPCWSFPWSVTWIITWWLTRVDVQSMHVTVFFSLYVVVMLALSSKQYIFYGLLAGVPHTKNLLFKFGTRTGIADSFQSSQCNPGLDDVTWPRIMSQISQLHCNQNTYGCPKILCFWSRSHPVLFLSPDFKNIYY